MLAGRLKGRHLVFFWGGLVFDSTGTGIMFEIAGEIGADIHSVTKIIAIPLMVIHAIWATAVLARIEVLYGIVSDWTTSAIGQSKSSLLECNNLAFCHADRGNKYSQSVVK